MSQKKNCPCKKSAKNSFYLECTECKQSWHSTCVGLKGRDISQKFILALENWACSWCYVCPAVKPTTHPAYKREQSLLVTAVSDAVTTNLASSVKEVTDSVTATIDSKLKEIVDSSLEATLTKVVGIELNRLQKFKDEIVTLKDKADSRPKSSPYTNLNIANPTEHVEDCKENFIDEDTGKQIRDFLGKQTFHDLNGRSVLSYGEKYTYNGSGPPESHQKAIPNVIQNVIKSIESNYDKCQINSCLINKYSGKDSVLPEHADDERTIEPGSSIYTVSIGASCVIKFRDGFTGEEKAITVNDRDIYTMSQQSQCFWTHRIDKGDVLADDNEEDTIRYSLTFRSVGDRYRNSTIIQGDSNTKYLKFGPGKGHFGYYLPGQRVETYHIKNIDPVSCIGYQNIILHVGINDLLDTSPGRNKEDLPPTDIQGHLVHLVSKVETIQKLCPCASIIISPILPTKMPHINERVVDFNMTILRVQTHSYSC